MKMETLLKKANTFSSKIYKNYSKLTIFFLIKTGILQSSKHLRF